MRETIWHPIEIRATITSYSSFVFLSRILQYDTAFYVYIIYQMPIILLFDFVPYKQEAKTYAFRLWLRAVGSTVITTSHGIGLEKNIDCITLQKYGTNTSNFVLYV
jgi:hypothetical protein